MQEFLDKNKNLIVFILSGLFLIGLGVFSYKTNIFSSGDKVEVIQKNKDFEDQNKSIMVEISGSVEKPGVYSFKEGQRINDLLIAAGGLSASADREWVDKNINRAGRLIDGQKIYIFSQSEITSAKKMGGGLEKNVLSESVSNNYSGLININTADQKSLENLIGIGPVYAQKIIDGRIYSNIEELVTRKIIPQKTFDKIKDEISVY